MDRWTTKDDLDAAFYGIVGPQVNRIVSIKISGLMKINAAGGPRPGARVPVLARQLWS